MQIGKKEVKLLLFADEMIAYVSNFKNSIHLTMDGDRNRDPHWSTVLSSQGPDEQKEGEHEQGSQDREGCIHPRRPWD